MITRETAQILLSLPLFLLVCVNALAQSQTTGGIAGTAKDQNGSVIVGAEVTVIGNATGNDRMVFTDTSGSYVVAFLPPGTYRIRVAAKGFEPFSDNVQVVVTETRSINPELGVVGVIVDPVQVRTPLIERDGPQLGRAVDSRVVSNLPLATRNFTQILALSPGTAVSLPDNTAVGRNSQHISVNGARV